MKTTILAFAFIVSTLLGRSIQAPVNTRNSGNRHKGTGLSPLPPHSSETFYTSDTHSDYENNSDSSYSTELHENAEGPDESYGEGPSSSNPSNTSSFQRIEGVQAVEELISMTPLQLVAQRPERSQNGNLKVWQQAFDLHPAIARLSSSMSPETMEYEFRRLREGNTDGTINRLMTLELKRNLLKRKFPTFYVGQVMEACKLYRDAVNEQKRNKNKSIKPRQRVGEVRRLAEEKAKRAAIVEELREAEIDPILDAEDMEEQLRQILDRHPNSKNKREAIRLYLSPDHTQDYTNSVITLFVRKDRHAQQKLKNDRAAKEKRQKNLKLPSTSSSSSAEATPPKTRKRYKSLSQLTLSEH